MSVIDIMEIGKQGLDANRQALQTTSNNIANANTPGYSRQRAVITTNEPPPASHGRIPGVRLKEVIRVQDGFVQNQIINESKTFAGTKAKMEGLKRVESMVHNDAFRIGDLVNHFFNDVRELSANPEINALRNNVAYSAQAAATGFRALNSSLEGLKVDLDSQISVGVKEINTLAKEIASLNSSIAQFNAKGEPALELMDRRDANLRELSQKFGYQLSTDEQESANITAGGVGVLVNGPNYNELVLLRTEARGDKTAGSVDIYVKDGAGLRLVTPSIKEGELGGVLYVRDQVINPTLKHLDAAAYQFATNVNAIHRQGYGSDGMTGRNLFTDFETPAHASALIDLGHEVGSGKSKITAEAIAVGIEPGLAGDNRVPLQLSQLQNTPLLPNDISVQGGWIPHQSINESLNSMVGKIAVETEHEDQMFRHQEAILNQLENYRQSVSGVNLDEEAISLVQYQTVFNASAKAMKVGDELLQVVLSLKT